MLKEIEIERFEVQWKHTRLRRFLFTYLFYKANKLVEKKVKNGEEDALEAVMAAAGWPLGFNERYKGHQKCNQVDSDKLHTFLQVDQ